MFLAVSVLGKVPAHFFQLIFSSAFIHIQFMQLLQPFLGLHMKSLRLHCNQIVGWLLVTL